VYNLQLKLKLWSENEIKTKQQCKTRITPEGDVSYKPSLAVFAICYASSMVTSEGTENQ